MTVGKTRLHRRSLGVGLGISAMLHGVAAIGYGLFVANGGLAPENREVADRAIRNTDAFEVVRLVEQPVTPPVDRTVAVSAAGSPAASRPIAIPTAVQTALPARLAPTMSVQTASAIVPVGTVTSASTRVGGESSATGWRPGLYEGDDEDRGRGGLLSGLVLGTGGHCPTNGPVISVNRVSPFGGF